MSGGHGEHHEEHHGEHHEEHHAEAHAPHAEASSPKKGGGFKQGMKSVGNLADNLISTPFRGGGIVANTALDISDTLNNLNLRSAEIRRAGNQDIREIISESGRGSFWKRLLKVPIGFGLATGKYVESRVRSVVTPLWHGLRDGLDTVGNPVMNTGRGITYIPNTNPADTYKFDKLVAREYEKKGRDWMKLMPWKKGGTVSGDKGGEPAPVHVDAHHPVAADHAHAQPAAHVPEAHSTPTDHAQEAAQAAVIAEMKSQSDAIKDLTKKMQEQDSFNQKLQQQIIAQTQENNQLKEALAKATTQTPTHKDVKEEHHAEIHNKDTHKGEHKEDHSGTDAMKKDADTIKHKLSASLPKNFDVSWDEMPKGMQKLSARNKEGKHRQEPEVAITVYEPGKIRVKYNPSDHYEEFYYYAESTLDKADKLLSAIAGVVGKKSDLHALEAAGMEKVDTKSTGHAPTEKHHTKDGDHAKDKKHDKEHPHDNKEEHHEEEHHEEKESHEPAHH